MFAAISVRHENDHDPHSRAWAKPVTPNLAHERPQRRLVLNTVTVPHAVDSKGACFESNLRSMDDEFYEDDFDDDEVIENAVLCPTCEDVTGHQILKEKKWRGKDYLLRCETCSTVHEIQFRALR